MATWHLQPEGIAAVLAAVEADLDGMNQAWSARRLESVATDMEAAGPAAADVTSAVVALLNAQGERLTSMGNRASAGLVGVESAVGCFENAQLDMLGQCQSQMLASAASGDFSWWYGSRLPAGAV
jgi:hypothetical protein